MLTERSEGFGLGKWCYTHAKTTDTAANNKSKTPAGAKPSGKPSGNKGKAKSSNSQPAKGKGNQGTSGGAKSPNKKQAGGKKPLKGKGKASKHQGATGVNMSATGASSVATKGGKTSSQKPTPSTTKLPFRVTEQQYKRLVELFGSGLENPTDGALRVDGLWECLRRLGDKHYGGGRWLPNRECLKGEESNLSWTSEATAQGGVFDECSIKGTQIVMRFPGSIALSRVCLERLWKSRVVAHFGKLCYYVNHDGSMPVLRTYTADSALRIFGKTMSYYAWGQTYYMVDAPLVENADRGVTRQMLDATTSVAAMASNLVLGTQEQVSVPVVAVPSGLLQDLYPKAAGRERNKELLRSLERYAAIAVRESDLVHPACRGVVASKLAFLALTYNAEAEMEMYRTHVPAALGINAAADRAWSGGRTTRDHTTMLVCASLAFIAWRTRGTWQKKLRNAATFVSAAGSRPQEFASEWDVRCVLAKECYWRGRKRLSQLWDQVRVAGIYLYGAAGMLPSGVVRASIADIVVGNSAALAGGSEGLLLGATFISATAEELFKRLHPAAEMSLLAVEGAHHGVGRYWPTFLVHVVCTRLGLIQGVALHTAWNCYVTSRFKREVGAQLSPPDDVCLDDTILRLNEPIAAGNTLTHREGLPVCGRLPCQKPGKSWHFCAVGVDTVEVTVYRSCVCNERAAIMSRVTAVDNADNDVWDHWWPQGRKMGMVTCPDYQKWLNHLPSRAKGLVERASSTSVLDGHGQTIKAFVKREKAVTSINHTLVKSNPAPRIIQGRSVDVKIATGPFTWAYGKRLSAVYNSDGLFMYTGGASAEEIGRFKELAVERVVTAYDGPLTKDEFRALLRWVAVDCKRWDRSVGPDPLRKLNQEYREVGAPKECLIALKGRHGKRFAVSSRGWHFTRTAQVSSGDGDTSGGNTRVHLVMLEASDDALAAMASGDDALCLVITGTEESLCDHYRKGGFTPVLAKEVDFCSSIFWPTSDGLVLGPKIGRVLGKTFYCMNRFDSGDYLPWLRGVCLSLRTTCSYVPILRVLVPRLLSLCGRGKVWRESAHEYKNWASTSHSCIEQTWDFVMDRYGLDESDIEDMENEIAQVTIGQSLEGDRWVALVQRDIVGVG
jgi:hypothetical protein